MSDNVRVLAAARGTSPAAVAESLGRSRQWIQNKLAGRSRWTVADVEMVGSRLGVDAAVMVTTEWWPEQLLRARNLGDVRHQGLEPRTRWLATRAAA